MVIWMTCARPNCRSHSNSNANGNWGIQNARSRNVKTPLVELEHQLWYKINMSLTDNHLSRTDVVFISKEIDSTGSGWGHVGRGCLSVFSHSYPSAGSSVNMFFTVKRCFAVKHWIVFFLYLYTGVCSFCWFLCEFLCALIAFLIALQRKY